MFDKHSLLQRLQELSFPEKEYWVVAGAAMVLHGFRPQTRDIDLGCSTRLADKLEQQGCLVSRCDDGTRKISYSEDVEIFENWLEDTVEIISGVPVVSVDGLVQMKKKLGREKDLADIALIEKVREIKKQEENSVNMEIWDAYDKDGNKVGIDLIRGEKVPDGLYHMVCEVLVRHTDGDFLLMRRDPRKPSFPGLYEATAGGSAVKGEDADTCVRRELLEETGIRGEHFIPVDVIVSDENHCIYHEYFCETDCDKDSIRLQEGETVEYRWVDKATLVAMMDRNEVLLSDVDDQRIPKFLDMLDQGGIVPVTKERMRKYFESERFV